MNDSFEGWAFVEIMGHKRLVGHVSEREIAGKAFLKVDVTANGKQVTKYYSPESIYCLTPIEQDTAEILSYINDPAPITRWELPAPVSKDEAEPEDECLDIDDLDEIPID